MAEVNYSLGLLLSEQKKYDEATLYLARAAAAMPDNARAHYNLGQLLAYLGQQNEAEQDDFFYAAGMGTSNRVLTWSIIKKPLPNK